MAARSCWPLCSPLALLAVAALLAGVGMAQDRFSECTDNSPDVELTCQEMIDLAPGFCLEDFMVQQNYCAKTCGREPCPALSPEEQNILESKGESSRPRLRGKATGERKLPAPQELPAPPELPAHPPAIIIEPALPTPSSPEPPPEPVTKTNDETRSCVNIEDFIASRGDISLLGTTINATDMTGFLNAGGSVTLFAPNDDAFQSLLVQLEVQPDEFLNGNTEVLQQILELHTIPGQAIQSGDLTNGQSLSALLVDQDLTIMKDDNIIVKSSQTEGSIVEGDIRVCNGFVHIIDEVMVPIPFVQLRQALLGDVSVEAGR